MRGDLKMYGRRSIRLKGFDYSSAGFYFITTCVQNRECLFGKVAVGADLCVCPRILELNAAGQMVDYWWNEMKNKFKNIELHTSIVMPNHFHGIIQMGEHAGSPLHKIIQWFKTMTTNEYIRRVKNKNWQPFNGRLWQRNYYEQIIRNEELLNAIREYIINNPVQWDLDELNPMNRHAKYVKTSPVDISGCGMSVNVNKT